MNSVFNRKLPLWILLLPISDCLMLLGETSNDENGINDPDIPQVVTSPLDDLSLSVFVTIDMPPGGVKKKEVSPGGDALMALIEKKQEMFDENCNNTGNINSENCERWWKEIENLRTVLRLNYLACFGPNSPSLQFFNPRDQLCCNGQLYNMTSPYLSCCNKLVIDTSKKLCCNEIVYDQDTNRSVHCCGAFKYNIKDEICCYGNLFRSSADAACCSDKIYRSDTELCCDSTVIPRVSSAQQCCGNSSYNRGTQTCCNEHVSKAFRRNNEQGQCCGTKNYNVKCSRCVNETEVVSLIDTSRVCCSGPNITKALAVCCEGHICDDNILESTGNGLLNTTRMNSKISSDAHIIVFVICVSSTVFVVLFVCGSLTFLFIRRKKHLSSSMVINETSVGPSYEDITRIASETFVCYSTDYLVNETYIGESEKKMIELEKNGLLKETEVANDNFLENHFVNTSTQTCVKKDFNKETVLGTLFEYVGYLDADNPTLKMPNSEAVLTLPVDMLNSCPVEVHGSTFRSIQTIRERFNLDGTEAIASPTAEFWVTGYKQLPGYACLVYPFIGDANDLKVWKFTSDQEMYSTAKRLPVQRKCKTNEDLPMFYEIKGTFVYIYTKSFSGFICTTCGHRSLSLTAFLYGSYKRFEATRSEIRLALYIADDLNKFEDYRERMDQAEAVNGRMRKGEMKLKLPDVLKEDDDVKVNVNSTGAHDGLWIHKPHPKTRSPIYSEVQTVPLREVAYSCKDCPISSPCHAQAWEIPYKFEWYLMNRLGTFPNTNYQCIVDIHCEGRSRTGEAQCGETHIIIDELTLRPEDMHRHESIKVSQYLNYLREFLTNMEVKKQRLFLSGIKSVCQISALTVESCLCQLDQSMKPAGLNQAIIKGLQQAQLFEELDVLIKRGILKEQSMVYPIQRVQLTDEPMTLTSHPFLPQSYMHEEDFPILQSRQESSNEYETSLISQQSCCRQPEEEHQERLDNICRREMDTNSFAPASSRTLTKKYPEGGEDNPMNEYYDKNCSSGDSFGLPIPEQASLDETEVKEAPSNE